MPRHILNDESRIFTIGSCFAVEIRHALKSNGYEVYPKYDRIIFDPKRQQIANLPQRDSVNHYDTFTIRQEIERALMRKHWGDDSVWRLTKHPLHKQARWAHVFQDPLRRHCYADELDLLLRLRHDIDSCIDDGLEQSDIVIITLGLTECWRDRLCGLYVCLGPERETSESFGHLEFRPTDYDENYKNLSATVQAIRKAYPSKQIVLTVSPVRLVKTWTGEDIVVANTMSKSTLRAVAGQVCRDDPTIIYWPSFELSMLSNIYCSDAHHVRRQVVRHIVSAFHAAMATRGS
jgi:hypothetical protein